MSLAISISAIILLTSFELIKFDVELYETIPFNLSLICVTLYLLAFLNKLYFIDIIFTLLIIVLFVYHYNMFREKKEVIISKYNENFLCATIFVLLLFFICFFMRNRFIAGWDDLKFWAAQVKSLYYQNGYGKQYTNICPQFADYPMGSLLIEYWFCRLYGNFEEPLLYIGQMVFSISFLLPIVKKVPHNFIAIIVTGVLLLTFGTAFTRFGIGLEPDRIMAFAYGGALISAINIKEKPMNVFYRIQFCSVLCVLCLLKSIGFLWALFALIFYFVIISNYKSPINKKQNLIYGLFSGSVIVVITGLWNVYCCVFNRTTYLTTEMKNGLSMPIREQVNHIKKYSYIFPMFVKILFQKEMNCSSFYSNIRLCGIALSPFGFVLLIVIVYFVCYNKKIIIPHNIIIFCGVINIFYALVLLWSYFFMFYIEIQPDSIMHLQNMTSHYYEPAICGMVMCVWRIILENDYPIIFKGYVIHNVNFAILGLVTLMIVNIPMMYIFSFCNDTNNGYYEVSYSQRQVCYKEVKDTIAEIKKIPDKLDSRVLICEKKYNGADDIHFCVINYEASPISTINYTNDLDMKKLDLLIRENHCQYAYISGSYLEQEKIFSEYFGDDFSFDTLICMDSK